MMRNVKAFPHEEIIENELNTKVGGIQKMPTIIRHPGMDLRDYFAARAMQSIILSKHNPFNQFDMSSLGTDTVKMLNQIICSDAYKLADEMIKEREKNEKTKTKTG
jgi:hypothetical protein